MIEIILRSRLNDQASHEPAERAVGELDGTSIAARTGRTATRLARRRGAPARS
jgi:hypothetical protein